MKKIYAQEICVNDINVGDVMYECEFGSITKVEVLTKPERFTDGPDGLYKWEWKARDLETGRIINYLITEKYELEGPKLYRQPIDWKTFPQCPPILLRYFLLKRLSSEISKKN